MAEALIAGGRDWPPNRSGVRLARLGNLQPGGDCNLGIAETDGEILTLEEVAAFLKVGKRTVYRFAQNGQIPAFKLGGTWRFRRSELERWIDENSNQRKPDHKEGS